MNSTKELFLMDEITHFQRGPEQTKAKSMMSSVISHIETMMNGKGDKKDLLDKTEKTKKTVSIVAPSTSKISYSHRTNDVQQFSTGKNSKNSNYENGKAETGYSSNGSDSDSDIEFSKQSKVTRGNASTSGSSSSFSSNSRSNDESIYKNAVNQNYSNFSVSDDNMLNIPAFNTVKVTRADAIFAFIVFIVNLAEFATDFTLVVWHFVNGMKWASGLTTTFMITGAIGLLQQFSLLQRDHLERLFTRSRRIRILVNCFPPLATIVTAYQSSRIAFRSMKSPMYTNQFFEIEEFSKSLSKVQSFFQAAPLATLQLLIFIDNIHDISTFKALFTITNILISLIVMTIANLPAKSDYSNMESIHRAAYSPKSRLFVGLRMLSSFGSRAMAITFLILGFRCLFANDEAILDAVVVALFVMIIPRLVFTFIDYTNQLVAWKRLNQSADVPTSNEDNSPSTRRTNPRSGISLFDTMLGYSATVFFPVGDPHWVFWYVWGETALFVLFGNITGWANSCLDTLVNAIYTAIFIVVFIVVPILVPYARATVKKQRMKRLDKIFNWKNTDDTTENSNHETNSSQSTENKAYRGTTNLENSLP